MQNFLANSHTESQRQNIMVVAKENRKRVDKRICFEPFGSVKKLPFFPMS